MFYWLYCLKDEVNKNADLRTRSISFEDLMQRCVFHGAVVDDVLVADTLVVFAVTAKDLGLSPRFVHMCALLSELLPLPQDSQLREHLARIREPFLVADTIKAARAARIERGLPCMTPQHYKTLLVE